MNRNGGGGGGGGGKACLSGSIASRNVKGGVLFVYFIFLFVMSFIPTPTPVSPFSSLLRDDLRSVSPE